MNGDLAATNADFDADVAVVGAGPAGSAAAITLARAGLSVVVCDRARFPREKCCGDGLTTGALRRLEALGLERRSVPSFNVVHDLRVRSPSGRIVRLPLGRADGGDHAVHAAVATRFDLDASLVELAERAGSTVLQGHGLEGVDYDRPAAGGTPSLRLAGGLRVRADYVIAADGAWSPLRRLLATDTVVDSGPSDWHAFRGYARNVGPEASGQLWVWFPESILPGYAWSFPLPGGRANVGVCLERRGGGAELAAAWREVRDGPFLASLLGRQAEIEDRARSWPIPTGVSPERLSACRGRVLFAGDAAGAADPFTGEGIAQALDTGTAAAEAIMTAGGASPSAVAGAYRARIGATLALDHRLARAARAAMSHPLSARGALWLTDSGPWARRQVGRFLYEDYPRSLVLAPWRWRPGGQASSGGHGGHASPSSQASPGAPLRADWRRGDGRGR